MTNRLPWGRLGDRYKSEGPRRMLALDGGGIRGLLTLQVLAHLESLLADHYCRYDAELTLEGLSRLGLAAIDPKRVGGMDDVDAMPFLTDIGQALAKRVDLGHFGSFVDVPLGVVS